MIPKHKPSRIPKYLAWIRQQPCAVCGANAEVHHLIGHGGGITSGTHSDLEAFPLCPSHHRELHNRGHTTWEGRYKDQHDYVWPTIKRGIAEGAIPDKVLKELFWRCIRDGVI